jgi:solute carrier family 25 folate transporter 32
MIVNLNYQIFFLNVFYFSSSLSIFSFASTCTYPVQVIKTRLQQRSQALEISQETGKLKVIHREYTGGITDCVQRIWAREGIGGFFKGCIPNAIRVAPNAAITFVTYESVMDAVIGYENRTR